jgi:hypothetical protein
MVHGYTLRQNGYVDGIGRRGESLKSLLDGMNATVFRID